MKPRIRIFPVVLCLCLSVQGMAQQSVGIGTKRPDSCAALDITAANKGLLIPRVSLSGINDITTIANPKQSLLVYNTNAAITGGNGAGFYYWDGTSKWVLVGDSQPGWFLKGNANTTPGSSFVGTTNNASLRMRTNNTERVVVDSIGNVGIGLANLSLTAPRVRLQVDSSVLFGKDTAFLGGGSANKFYWNASKGALRAGAISNKNWDIDSIGKNSAAFGNNSKATGDCAVAMGGNNVAASGQGAVALGWGTSATNYGSTAMGALSKATGSVAVAMGNNTTASASYSVAMGNNTLSSGVGSVAMGNADTATSSGAIAMGLVSKSTGYGSIAMGNSVFASGGAGGGAIALGVADSAVAQGAIAIGQNNYSGNSYATAIGSYGRVTHLGAMILSDYPATGNYITSVANNQFTGAFSGGYRFLTDRSTPTNGTFITSAGSVGIGTNAPATKLQVNGSVSANVRTLSNTITSYAIAADDYFIVIPLNSSIAITMPSAAAAPGRMLYIQSVNPKVSSGSTAGAVTINVAGSDLFSLPASSLPDINNALTNTTTIVTSGATNLKLFSTGTYWMVSQ